MAEDAALNLRLKPEVMERLEALARDTKRSQVDVAAEAIEAYLDLSTWQIAHIRAALAEDRQGGPGVPHSEVAEWMESWGTGDERPRPESAKA